MSKIYKKALSAIQPLKLIEDAINDMMQKGEEDPEMLPLHYKFVCSLIIILEELQEEMRNEMNPS